MPERAISTGARLLRLFDPVRPSPGLDADWGEAGFIPRDRRCLSLYYPLSKPAYERCSHV